jgi:hypothetical protein
VALPFFFLYRCESCSFTPTDEHKLKVFENRVLRYMFGFKREEVGGESRVLHNENLHALYSSPHFTRIIK